MTDATRRVPTRNWIWLGLFALFIAFLGGSSRPDVIQIVALRPIAALFLIPALYFGLASGSFAASGRERLLAMLLALLALWMMLQLVPLPPSIWQSFAGRVLVVQAEKAVGLDGIWRPISMVPSRGWNALASLIVPVSAMALAFAFRAQSRTLLQLIGVLGALNAVFALLQSAGGSQGFLYWYRITNYFSPVGIFANENHSAFLSAICLVIFAHLFVTAKTSHERPSMGIVYATAFAVTLCSVVVSGSRGGFAMSAFALVAALLMRAVVSPASRRRSKRSRVEQWLSDHPKSMSAFFMLFTLGLLGAFFALERAPGLDGVFQQNAFEDLRWQILPTLQEMMATYWMVGSGFGSFEEVYHIFEPTELLLPTYINQAHNDWAQLVIEGGVPAVVLLAVALGWVGWSLVRLLRQGKKSVHIVLFWGAIFAILATASIVDYPLRTPIFQLIGVWLLLALALGHDNP